MLARPAALEQTVVYASFPVLGFDVAYGGCHEDGVCWQCPAILYMWNRITSRRGDHRR